MFQELSAPGGGESVCIQHIVFPTDQPSTSVYLRYESLDPRLDISPETTPRWDRSSIVIHERTAVSLDAVFNQLPEAYWLTYTQAAGFRFSATISGAGELQVWRRHRSGTDEMVGKQVFDTSAAGTNAVAINIEVSAPSRRTDSSGLLYIKIGARRQVVLSQGQWSALGVIAKPVQLVAGYCTFKREEQVFGNVRKVLEAPEIRDSLARLVVVDQGRSPELAANLAALAKQTGGDVLSVIQQDNFGGAGGFTRVMLEALGISSATHVLLMDDDAITETESIFRTAAFLSLTNDVAVGGQMLDLLYPDEVTETGAWFLADKLHAQANCPPRGTPRSEFLTTFASVAQTEYNGWWFFAAPLSAVRAVGLPLPFFIRYDDIEYGLRLTRHGIATVSLPGIGVWHEPFYSKSSLLTHYYDRRNKPVLVAMYYQFSGKKFAATFLTSAMQNLLSYRYDYATLDNEAMTQWLRGPKLIVAHPRADQARLAKAARLTDKRSVVAADTVTAVEDFRTLESLMAFVTPLKGREFWRAGIRAIARGLFGRRRPESTLPSLPNSARSCDAWWHIQTYPEVAVRPSLKVSNVTGDKNFRVYKHSASSFRSLLPRILLTYVRLRWGADACAARWTKAIPQFQTETFWKSYLGLGEGGVPSPTQSAPAQAHGRAAAMPDSIVPADADLTFARQ